MPKMKTHRGAAKRFKVTATGKIKRFKGYKSHLATGKPRSRKRQLRQPTLVAQSIEGRVRPLIPYK